MRAVSTVFLDRDGVINHNRADYVKNWSEFQFLTGARSAIARLSRAGYRIIVITNQACVGKGLTSPAEVDELHRRMIHAVGLAGGRIDAVLCCSHRSDEGCDCRKPAPGLILRARDLYQVDLSQAVFVGDSANDIRAASAVGMPAVLVLSGLGWRTALSLTAEGSAHCQLALNLSHAAWIIRESNATLTHEALWLRQIVSGARALGQQRLMWTGATPHVGL
jgi:D-glycero-D-manno-heptose 1,7-bisphosphate phosphatase